MAIQETLKGLTTEQVKLFQSIVDMYRQASRNTTGRSGDDSVDHQEFPAPDFFVALTPDGGIPPLNERIIHSTGTSSFQISGVTGTGTFDYPDVPGSAECEVYKILHSDKRDKDELWPVEGLKYVVYNKTLHTIPGETYIYISRDRNGKWWAIEDSVVPDCLSPGWDECYERIVDVRVHCATTGSDAGSIVTEIDVEYVRRCQGVLVSISDTPCP